MADEYMDPLSDPEYYQGGSDDNTVGIVINQLTNDENIELKTDVKDPLKLAMWDTIGERMKTQGLTVSAKLMEAIREKLIIYEVSHGRKSRKEIIEALKSYKEEESTKLQKLMSRGI